MSNREPFTLEAAMPRRLRHPERSAVDDESFNAPRELQSTKMSPQ
jgi:hypothetical protein